MRNQDVQMNAAFFRCFSQLGFLAHAQLCEEQDEIELPDEEGAYRLYLMEWGKSPVVSWVNETSFAEMDGIHKILKCNFKSIGLCKMPLIPRGRFARGLSQLFLIQL